MRIELLNENYFRKEDGTFDLDSALLMGGRIAGVCYSKDGYDKLINEDISKTQKRVELTINNNHHSVYGHIDVILNMHNIPKILSMVINNEHEYNTSEKSARYTKIDKENTPNVSDLELDLYNKWTEIFINEITKEYDNKLYIVFKEIIDQAIKEADDKKMDSIMKFIYINSKLESTLSCCGCVGPSRRLERVNHSFLGTCKSGRHAELCKFFEM